MRFFTVLIAHDFYIIEILLLHIFYYILLYHFSDDHGYVWQDVNLYQKINLSETEYDLMCFQE